MFPAYTRLGENRYREVFGLDFEQFEVGQVFRHHPGVTVSQQDNRDESADTLNCAHIHYDEHHAAHTEFRLPLFVSTATLQLLFGMAWKTYARKERILEYADISMTAPVFGGDTLYAESEVLGKAELDEACGKVNIELRGTNQKGVLVSRVTCWISIFRAGRHPFFPGEAPGPELAQPKFAAYCLGENGALQEQTGVFFDDFERGEVYEHAPRKIISAEEARAHALGSFDWNPRYIDSDYARRYFSEAQCPVPETYAMGAITAATTRTLGKVVANLGWKRFRIARHVYPDELISVATEIKDKRDSGSRPGQGILTVTTTCVDEQGRELASFDRVLLVYKKGGAPVAPGLAAQSG